MSQTYTPSGTPQPVSRGVSAPIRAEYKAIQSSLNNIYRTLPPGTSTTDPASTEFVGIANVAMQAQINDLAALVLSSPGVAPVWVSGTNYTTGNQVYSPVNFQTYRRKTNGAGTTDPSADTTNWQQITGLTPFDDPAYWMNV